MALLAIPVYALACTGEVPPQNPDGIYVVHEDGTVTDSRSGLMWKRCSEGQTLVGNACTGATTRRNWAGSMAAAEASSFAGYDDWRLPNVKELGTLVETCRVNPAINTNVFPDTPLTPIPAFWTSSPTARVNASAWFIGFDLGYALRVQRSGEAHSRLVRDVD